jgi:hypothetical protein
MSRWFSRALKFAYNLHMNGWREKVKFKKLLNCVFAVILDAAPVSKPGKKGILCDTPRMIRMGDSARFPGFLAPGAQLAVIIPEDR